MQKLSGNKVGSGCGFKTFHPQGKVSKIIAKVVPQSPTVIQITQDDSPSDMIKQLNEISDIKVA